MGRRDYDGFAGSDARYSDPERPEPEAFVDSVSVEQGHRIGFRYGVGSERYPCKARIDLMCNTAFATRLWEWLAGQGINTSPAPADAPKLGSGAPRLPAGPPAAIEGTFEDDEEEHEDHG